MRIKKIFFRLFFGRLHGSEQNASRRRRINPGKLLPSHSREFSNELLKVRVWQVRDGDGVLVSNGEESFDLRLYAIDAPEFDQPGGDAAKWALVRMIGGKNIYLETFGPDYYGRTLATIYVMRGAELLNVNEQLVMTGHAWVMKYCFDQLSKNRKWKLLLLERWAKSKRKGLWKLDNPMAPWEWRKLG